MYAFTSAMPRVLLSPSVNVADVVPAGRELRRVWRMRTGNAPSPGWPEFGSNTSQVPTFAP